MEEERDFITFAETFIYELYRLWKAKKNCEACHCLQLAAKIEKFIYKTSYVENKISQEMNSVGLWKRKEALVWYKKQCDLIISHMKESESVNDLYDWKKLYEDNLVHPCTSLSIPSILSPLYCTRILPLLYLFDVFFYLFQLFLEYLWLKLEYFLFPFFISLLSSSFSPILILLFCTTCIYSSFRMHNNLYSFCLAKAVSFLTSANFMSKIQNPKLLQASLNKKKTTPMVPKAPSSSLPGVSGSNALFIGHIKKKNKKNSSTSKSSLNNNKNVTALNPSNQISSVDQFTDFDFSSNPNDGTSQLFEEEAFLFDADSLQSDLLFMMAPSSSSSFAPIAPTSSANIVPRVSSLKGGVNTEGEEEEDEEWKAAREGKKRKLQENAWDGQSTTASQLSMGSNYKSRNYNPNGDEVEEGLVVEEGLSEAVNKTFSFFFSFFFFFIFWPFFFSISFIANSIYSYYDILGEN